MKNRLISLTIAFAAVMFLSWNFMILGNEQEKSQIRQNKLLAVQELTVYGDRIQNILNRSFQYADFFDVLIARDQNLAEEIIEEYASIIISQNKMIKNIGLAPDAIVTNIYPLEGNEEALGHDLLADPYRREFITEAIENKRAVTQGPLEALQGGDLVFSRKPIFINDGSEFWGLSIITVDFDEIIRESNIKTNIDGHLLSIRVRRTDGINDFLWGYSEIFEKDSIKTFIVLPDTMWEMAIYKDGGWYEDSLHMKELRGVFYITLMLIFILIYWYVNNYQKQMELAKRDSLTGTLNKKAFREYVRNKLTEKGKKHGICVIDLNGFKDVNDSLGHPVGDVVLIEIANRIKKDLRNIDRVSRFGGDEYIIFLNDIKDVSTIDNIISRIKKRIEEPIFIEDYRIEICVAIGYGIFPDDATSYEELYSIADSKMYKNKDDMKKRTIDSKWF